MFSIPAREDMRAVAGNGEEDEGMVARCCCMMAREAFDVFMLGGYEYVLRLEGSEVSLVRVQWSEVMRLDICV